MTQDKDKMRAEFEAWWESDGQFIRAGGGDYEKTFAYSAWQAARVSAPQGVPEGWQLVPVDPASVLELGWAYLDAAREAEPKKAWAFSHAGYRAMLAAAPQPVACACEACKPNSMRMIVCATCGNKRCPHATDHRNACTNSNEPGQKGSSYEHAGIGAAAPQPPK